MITFIGMLSATVIWLESNKVFQFELTYNQLDATNNKSKHLF